MHVGGGLEGGLITGEPHPGTVAELGAGIDYLLEGKQWGFGAVIERVARTQSELPIASEHKLDLLVRFTHAKRKFRGAIGVGLRRLRVDGDLDRPASTLRGFDLFRMGMDIPITGGLEFYFAWTFGLYRGEVYRERTGDMPYTMRDASTMTTSYVLGLQGAIDL